MSQEERADTRDMCMVHTMFRREFAALPTLVRGVAPQDAERTYLIAEHIDLLTAVLEAHHRAEDTHLWPKLRDRGGEDLASIVRAMEGQHEHIEVLTAEMAAALGEWRKWRDDPAASRRGNLADVLGRLHGVLDAHMGMEEELILPLAEKYVTAAEWQAMARASGAGLPPGTMPLVFGMTSYEADPELIENTLSALPVEIRRLLEQQGPQEFAAHSTRINGTPTPPRIGAVER